MTDYRVLIVDDQRDVRYVLRSGLESLKQQIEVIAVPSGEEAMLVISRQPIDLLVTDVRLPGITGLELYERTKVRNPNLKFMLITGVTQPKLRRQVANAGADAFFFKPVVLSEFLDAVKTCLDIVDVPLSEDLEEAAVESELPTLSERMAIMHQDLEAASVILMGNRGEIMAQTETLSDQVITPTFISLLMATISAAGKVADLVNAGAFKDLIYFAGSPYDLVVSQVGDAMLLLSILPSAGEDDKRLIKWMRVVRPAVKDLLKILTEMGVPIEEPDEDPIIQDMDELDEEEVDISDVLPEIDALFEQAGQSDFQSQDVDDFWQTVVTNEDTQEQLTSSDSITYEQAQQLGLAPEDE